jgi:hypothetical protein
VNLEAAPGEAVADGGALRLGVYRGTLARTALERWASPLRLKLRRKWWQYVVVLSEDVVAGAAVANLGYVGMAFAFAWDRRQRTWYEREALVPLAHGVVTEGEPGANRFGYRGRAGKVTMTTTAEERLIAVDFATPAGRLEMELELAAPGDGCEALTVIGALAPGGMNITHKEAGVSLGGRIALSGREIELEPGTATGLLDWTQGVPPANVRWNWAMGAGRAKDGRSLGFNLCVGYTDPAHSENAVWVDGRVHRVGEVAFAITPSGGGAWRMRSADGALDLSFAPEAERSANTNLVLAVSRYRQPVGRYTGWLPGPLGERVEIGQASGVAEDHVARW